MRIIQNIDAKVYFRIVVVMTSLFTISFFFAFAKSEGAEGLFLTIMSFPAKVFGVPLLWVFIDVFKFENPLFFLIAIILDILLFALFVERLIYWFRLKRSRKVVVRRL